MPRNKKQKNEDLEDDEILDSEPPTDVDPYEILGLEKTATADEVKKAYRKAALQHHPDKAKEADKPTAHTTFQRIALAYAVLSTSHRRARYDATGRTDESLYPGEGDDDEPFDWLSFYRGQFDNVVNEDAINNIKADYVGSEEEKADVLRYYTECKGNMKKLYENIMFAEPWVDEERLRGVIDAAIEAGEVEGYKKYTEETEAQRTSRIAKAKKWAEREAKEVDEENAKKEDGKKGAAKKGKGGKAAGGMGDLAALIQQRQKARSGGFFEHLEEKYAPRGKKRPSEPPEEAFAAMEESGKASRKKSKIAKEVDWDEEEEDDDDVAEEDSYDDESEEEKPKPKAKAKRAARAKRSKA